MQFLKAAVDAANNTKSVPTQHHDGFISVARLGRIPFLQCSQPPEMPNSRGTTEGFGVVL